MALSNRVFPSIKFLKSRHDYKLNEIYNKLNPSGWKGGKYYCVIKFDCLISRIKFQSSYTHEFRERCAGLFFSPLQMIHPFFFILTMKILRSLLLLDLSFLICSSLFSIHTYSVYWLRISGSVSLFCIDTYFVANFTTNWNTNKFGWHEIYI